MPDMDLPGAPGGGGKEHLRSRVMRVLLQEMVLIGPYVVKAEPVGDLDFGQRLLDQPMLGIRHPKGVATAARRSGRTSWRASPLRFVWISYYPVAKAGQQVQRRYGVSRCRLGRAISPTAA